MRDHLERLTAIVGLAWRADRRGASGSAGLQILAELIVPVEAFAIAKMVSAIIQGDSTNAYVAGAILTVGVILRVFMTHVGSEMQVRLQERATHAAEREVMALISSVPTLAPYEDPTIGDRISTFRTRISDLANVGAIIRTAALGISLVVTTVMLVAISWPLIVIPLFAILAFTVYGKSSGNVVSAEVAAAADRRRAEELFALVTNSTAADEVRLFGLRQELVARHKAAALAYSQRMERAELAAVTRVAGGWAIYGLMFIASALYLVWRAESGVISAVSVLLMLLLAQRMNDLVWRGADAVGSLATAVRVADNLLWLRTYSRNQAATPGDVVAVPDQLHTGIQLRNLSFRYPNAQKDALSDITLSIPEGRTIAIVGENGAGKTTLIKLLCGFYRPTRGTITVDGVDLADVSITAWRDEVAAGFQDFVRFELILRESVGIGDLPRMSDDEAVTDALARSGASRVPDALPVGLDTPLGDSWPNGSQLSVGNWQKVALARSAMRPRPHVLVLDEPTASLDTETEYDMFRRIADAEQEARSRGSVTVLVSHRFSTVRMADLIVVVDKGRIIETGHHGELMLLGGVYAELFSLQARDHQ